MTPEAIHLQAINVARRKLRSWTNEQLLRVIEERKISGSHLLWLYEEELDRRTNP